MPFKTPPFFVGNFNDEDPNMRWKIFTPPKRIANFRLDNDYATPKYFTVTALMAEIDGNGFTNFVNYLYDSIKETICGLLGDITKNAFSPEGVNRD